MDLIDVSFVFKQLQHELELANVDEAQSFDAHLRLIESDLSPHFSDVNVLRKFLQRGALCYEHAFLKRTRNWSKVYVDKIINDFNAAKQKDVEKFKSALFSCQVPVNTAFYHMSHISELQKNALNLENKASIRSAFRDIGDIIEAIIFPLISLRKEMIDICENKPNDINSKAKYTLGNLVNYFLAIEPKLFKPEPFNIPLNQWRNIAHHSDYKIRDGIIICSYGTMDNRKSFNCRESDLIELIDHIQNVFYLHRTAFEILCIDNNDFLDENSNIVEVNSHPIQEWKKEIEIAEVTYWGLLVFGLVASGFYIENVCYQDNKWGFLLYDKKNRRKTKAENDLKRALSPYLMMHPNKSYMNFFISAKVKKYWISFSCEAIAKK